MGQREFSLLGVVSEQISFHFAGSTMEEAQENAANMALKALQEESSGSELEY